MNLHFSYFDDDFDEIDEETMDRTLSWAQKIDEKRNRIASVYDSFGEVSND